MVGVRLIQVGVFGIIIIQVCTSFTLRPCNRNGCNFRKKLLVLNAEQSKMFQNDEPKNIEPLDPIPTSTTYSSNKPFPNDETPTTLEEKRRRFISWAKNVNLPIFEMRVMSAIGITLSVGVIFTLAMNSSSELRLPSMPQILSGQVITEEVTEEIGDITMTVMKSAMPTSATEVVAVTVGEGIAGVIGAIATFFVTWALKLRDAQGELEKKRLELSTAVDVAVDGKKKDMIVRNGVAEAVADGDYFLTRAAALPLLEAVGIPSSAASLVSVLLAVVPYEVIKQVNRRGMDTVSSENEPNSVETTKTTTTTGNKTNGLDFVEIVSDITKWLEYDVLSTDFAGRLPFQNKFIESATFGFLSALSSQLYADLLYQYSNFGSDAARKAAKNRTLDQTISLYVTKSFSSAALFGAYEVARIPVYNALKQVLAGGVDSCVGSTDFDLCIETFMIDNPPGATFEAQVRGLVTFFFGVLTRLGFWSVVDEDLEMFGNFLGDFQSLVGEWLKPFSIM